MSTLNIRVYARRGPSSSGIRAETPSGYPPSSESRPAVSAFVASVVRDFRDRDDVLQDFAVAVVESFESYDPDRPFVAWAMGVARNQVGLNLRKRRRDRLVFDEATIAGLAVAFSEVAPISPGSSICWASASKCSRAERVAFAN